MSISPIDSSGPRLIGSAPRTAKAVAADLDAMHAGDAPRAMSPKTKVTKGFTPKWLNDSMKPGAPPLTEDIPPTLGACADALYTLREQRLIVEKQAEAIKARETAIRNHLIDTLPKDDSTGTSGKVARAQLKTKQVPTVEDWPTLYKYVKRTGAFELLQRRLSTEAIAERWEAGHKVPGVEAFNLVTVSVTKL